MINKKDFIPATTLSLLERFTEDRINCSKCLPIVIEVPRDLNDATQDVIVVLQKNGWTVSLSVKYDLYWTKDTSNYSTNKSFTLTIQ